VNEEIVAPRVRLIDATGEQMGIVSLRDALNAARERGLDLVEVAPGADPPVCKILDYGKYQYLQMKRQREARKAQKIVEVKEIRLRPKTDEYHTGFKVRQARRFILAGMKVKVRIQFRGREITHSELGHQQLKEFADEMADIAAVEQKPNMDGRTMLMVLAPSHTASGHHPSVADPRTDGATPGKAPVVANKTVADKATETAPDVAAQTVPGQEIETPLETAAEAVPDPAPEAAPGA